ncbi:MULTISPECIES: DUF3592 domain-containing protein [unclassified Conexibacter]|uniref:DUF3592 domain-containing protein n=1 Tax=unclassified Conexibacter TaxID=2627773 RepID=UPI00351C2F13
MLFLAPLLLALYGVAALVSLHRNRRRTARAPGVVLGFDSRDRRRGPLPRFGRGARLPVVRFRTADGREIVTLAATSAVLAALRAGDRVAVLYDRAEPTRARLDHLRLLGACSFRRASARPARAGPSTPACRLPCPS